MDDILSNGELYHEIIIKQHLFSFEVILKAAYMFLNRLYFVFDELEYNEIKVMIRSKIDMNKETFDKLIADFNNELVNYSVYVTESSKTNDLRAVIMEKFLTSGKRGEEIKEELDKSRPGGHDNVIIDSSDDAQVSDSEITGLSEDEDPYSISKLWEDAENSIDDEPVNPNLEETTSSEETNSENADIDSDDSISKLWEVAEQSIEDDEDNSNLDSKII